jgi:proteic killer suppression protein
MIRSFRCSDTKAVFQRKSCRRFQAIERVALRKLVMIDAAKDLKDLSVVPGNQLEKLKADRAGQHSIRVNDQWGVCFVWDNGDATDVEIVDYH